MTDIVKYIDSAYFNKVRVKRIRDKEKKDKLVADARIYKGVME